MTIHAPVILFNNHNLKRASQCVKFPTVKTWDKFQFPEVLLKCMSVCVQRAVVGMEGTFTHEPISTH